MAKPKSQPKSASFLCTECGSSQPQWLGQCPSCGAWGTIAEAAAAKKGATTVLLSEIDPLAAERTPAVSPELNRVLGGGFVPGAVILLSGDPGIGKSTLALQACQAFGNALYVAGEESPAQVKLRAERTLGSVDTGIRLTTETTAEGVCKVIEQVRPDFLVIDSIQTMQVEALGAAAGPVNQIREATALILRAAKSLHLPALIIGHVTKSGDVAGPMLLEHLVDAVLLLEQDLSGGYRLLRGLKNRFGATDEVGLFAMTESGMRDVGDPSEILLPAGTASRKGSAVTASLEGRRPLLVELQALTVSSPLGMPRRVSTGIDANRLAMLLAVLEKHGGLAVSRDDVYVNSAGGFRLKETAVDLGVVAAVASAVRERALPEATVFLGEVGLGGEVRPVARLEARLKEAETLGFRAAVIPLQKLEDGSSLLLKPVRNIGEVLEKCLA